MESFHGKLRDECLNASWFGNLWEPRAKIRAWKKKYYEEWPHSSLGYQTRQRLRHRLAVEKTRCGNPWKAGVPQRLEIPQRRWGFHFPTASATIRFQLIGKSAQEISYDLVREARIKRI